jgi:hypothetical protein
MPILSDEMWNMFALVAGGLGLAFITFPMAHFMVKIGAMLKGVIRQVED